jgi:tetratricopeptide (TPR) repeat protein
MRRYRLWLLTGVLIAASAGAWCAPLRRAVLVDVKGTVKVQRGSQGTWNPVATPPDRDLYPKDQVQTYQRSSATILIDGNRVTIGANTRVGVPEPRAAGAPRGMSRIRMITGKLLLWIIGRRDVEVGAAGVVAAASGTKFVLEIDGDEVTTLTVLEGEVSFYNDLGQVVLGANEQSKASETMAPTRPMAVDPSAYLEWEASLEGMQTGFEYRHYPTESRDRLKGMADEACKQADANPNDPEAQIRAGDALHDLGSFEAAATYYGKALDLTPGNASARVSLGHSLLEDGKIPEAESAFQQAAQAAPNTAAPLIGLGAARLATGKGPEGAIDAADRALAVEPQNALAHAVAGLAAMRTGNAAAARESLGKALAADAKVFQAHAFLSAVELAESNREAALAAARKAVELAPASALAHASLATAAFFTGDAATARGECALALEANPSSVAAHLVQSDILVAEGELTQAADEAGLALALDPNCAPASAALGMIALAQSDLTTADRCFSRALELSPSYVAARTGMGVTYAREGKLAKALEMQKAAIALDSGSAATHNNLGAIHLAKGKLEEAATEFTQAADLQPEWAMPHANLAMAYLDENRFADAVREGELAVRLGENSARAYTTLGRVYLEQNRTNKAWAALRKAVDLDRTYALAHFELAEVYLRLGRARDARREQLEAIALQPSAALETREYARTEARVEAGSLGARLRTDGRADNGLTSYFLSGEHEISDWGRTHSSWERTSTQGILGRQPSADRAAALLFATENETRDRPGAVLAGGAPEDPDYESTFSAWEAHALGRIGSYDRTRVTVKLTMRDSQLGDTNPDSLLSDPKPFPRMNIRFSGPLAEVRLDKQFSDRDRLTAGIAGALEKRKVSGIVGTPNPAPDPPTWTPFANEEQQNSATLYLEHEHRLGAHTTMMLGGRIAATNNTTTVVRPKAWVRHDVGHSGTLVLLTRPVLRDDVSELSPVDYWALSDGLSPLDFSDGGFGQSYELQYQLMPRNGSLLRVGGFHRSLRNYLVDLSDPTWAPGEAAAVLARANLSGAEIEFEHWLTRDLSVGAWARYTDSENNDAGGPDIPFQPKVLGLARLDYLSPSGLRASARWRYIGSRYADLTNATKAGAYDVLDLAAACQMNLHTDLFLGVDNVLDETAGFYPGYPSRGRWIHGGVEYRF